MGDISESSAKKIRLQPMWGGENQLNTLETNYKVDRNLNCDPVVSGQTLTSILNLDAEVRESETDFVTQPI